VPFGLGAACVNAQGQPLAGVHIEREGSKRRAINAAMLTTRPGPQDEEVPLRPKKKILLVGDDADRVGILRYLLVTNHYACLGVQRGEPG